MQRCYLYPCAPSVCASLFSLTAPGRAGNRAHRAYSWASWCCSLMHFYSKHPRPWHSPTNPLTCKHTLHISLLSHANWLRWVFVWELCDQLETRWLFSGAVGQSSLFVYTGYIMHPHQLKSDAFLRQKLLFPPEVFLHTKYQLSSITTVTKVHIMYNVVKELWVKVRFLLCVCVCTRLMFLISHL